MNYGTGLTNPRSPEEHMWSEYKKSMYGLASVCHQMQAAPEREGPPVKQFYAAEADPKELVSARCLLTSPPHWSSKSLLVEKLGDAGPYLL